MADRAFVIDRVMRMLGSGLLSGMPKVQADGQLLAALGAAGLGADRELGEAELNLELNGWLQGFSAPNGLDHATLRRRMVDEGLLLRDPSGTGYRVSGERLAALLEPDALDLQPRELLEELRREREERRLRHQGNAPDSGNRNP